MAINFNNPALANNYSNLLADIRDMETALAVMDFTDATAIPTLTKRWSATNSRFEVWNGSAWGALMPDASTSVRGLVLLSDSLTSTSTVLGATANAVRQAAQAASTAQAGRVELATDAETQTGTDATRAVTPAGLRACTATETRIGVVELATNAEAVAGSDTSRAVTPSGLAAAISTQITNISNHVSSTRRHLLISGGASPVTIPGASNANWQPVSATAMGVPITARTIIVSAGCFFYGTAGIASIYAKGGQDSGVANSLAGFQHKWTGMGPYGSVPVQNPHALFEMEIPVVNVSGTMYFSIFKVRTGWVSSEAFQILLTCIGYTE